MFQICHVEIPILDKEKAKEFYKSALDWNIEFGDLPNYGFVNRTGVVSIGFPVKDQLDTTDLKIYIEVDDIDKRLGLISKNGGKVEAPKSLISDTIGYGAKFKDCFGNRIGLYAPK